MQGSTPSSRTPCQRAAHPDAAVAVAAPGLARFGAGSGAWLLAAGGV